MEQRNSPYRHSTFSVDVPMQTLASPGSEDAILAEGWLDISPFRRHLAALKSQVMPDSVFKRSNGHAWAIPLTLAELHERISLLAELEIPCVFSMRKFAGGQLSGGVVREVNRGMNRFQLVGDSFSYELREEFIDSIWLVSVTGSGANEIAVEIYNETGGLIMQIFGMPDGLGAAVWQDVMGNPSLSVA